MFKALAIKLITVKHIVHKKVKSTTFQLTKHHKKLNKSLKNYKKVTNSFSEMSNTNLNNLKSQTKFLCKVKYLAAGFQESFNSLN